MVLKQKRQINRTLKITTRSFVPPFSFYTGPEERWGLHCHMTILGRERHGTQEDSLLLLHILLPWHFGFQINLR